MALINERLKDSRHGDHVVEDRQVRHQMIVPDHLALFFPVVLTDDTFSAKGGPLHKLVPVFCPIGRGSNGPPQLWIADKVE